MLQVLLFIIIFFFLFDLYKKNRLLRDEISRLRDGKLPSESKPQARAESAPPEMPEPVQAQPSETPEPVPVHEPAPVRQLSIPGEPKQSLEPAEPSELAEAIRRFFTGGNLLVKVGGFVFFLGLVFLVKYAAEHNMISIEVRLIAVAVAALVITGIGWRLRKREGYYGLILQALGVASFYLVVFASAKLYGLITMPQAFVIMLIVVIGGSALAVAQDAVVLALFSVTGGFLVPILTSDGGGSHIVLFSYYALLNVGVLLIAWYRSWRVLNVVGFFFTFVIAAFWGVLRYEPALFATTEPFIVFFFLLYLAVSVLYTWKQSFRARGFIDATLVFGVPLAAFSLQASMIDRFAYGVFFSALAVGVLYLVLSRLLRQYEKMRTLSEAFLAISIVFFTVAVPYALDDNITGALWALEASAVIWISLKYERRYGVLFGVALELAAIVIYVLSTAKRHAEYAFANGIFLGYAILVAAAIFSAYRFWKVRRDGEESIFNTFYMLFFAAGMLLWFAAGIIEARRAAWLPGNVMLIYMALSVAAFALTAMRTGWPVMKKMLQFYLPLGLLFFSALLPHYVTSHPFKGIGGIAVALFFAVHYFLLVRFAVHWTLRTFLHAAGMIVLVLILSREAQYGVSQLVGPGTLTFGTLMLLPMLTLFAVGMGSLQRLPAVIRENRFAYEVPGSAGLAVIAGLWELAAFARAGAVPFMPYVPLLSLLDMLQAAGAAAVLFWLRRLDVAFVKADIQIVAGGAALFAFAFLTAVLGRSVHFYGGVDYTMAALGASLLFQALLSILWSSMGIGAMLYAKHRGMRPVWMAGAGILAVVVIKLFVTDLAGSGTVERIVSFIFVGTLLLLVGYFAPIPPAEQKNAKARES